MTTYRRVDNPPPIDRPTLHVTWARLAVLWWRDVRVSIAEPVQLNELDDFVIAAVARLGYLHAQAFEEFTGLPPLVFNGLARRLHNLRLLDWRNGTLRPADTADTAQTPRKAARTTTAALDFLYLPDTDDLLVIQEGLAVWERAGLQPVGASPLPLTLHRMSVHKLLATRIQQGRVADMPPDVVSLAEDDDEALTAMAGADPQPPVPVCPVFQCAATLVIEPDRIEIQLDVTESPRQRKKKSDNRVTVDISGATGLASHWSQAIATLAKEPDQTEKAMRSLGFTEPPWPSLSAEDLGGWQLFIDGRHARTLADRALLTLPVGLQIRQPHFHLTVALQLVPTDDDARRMIRLDRVLQEVLQDHGAHGGPIGKHHAHVREVGGAAPLLARAWHLKYYSLVYALRENEDFDYD